MYSPVYFVYTFSCLAATCSESWGLGALQRAAESRGGCGRGRCWSGGPTARSVTSAMRGTNSVRTSAVASGCCSYCRPLGAGSWRGQLARDLTSGASACVCLVGRPLVRSEDPAGGRGEGAEGSLQGLGPGGWQEQVGHMDAGGRTLPGMCQHAVSATK